MPREEQGPPDSATDEDDIEDIITSLFGEGNVTGTSVAASDPPGITGAATSGLHEGAMPKKPAKTDEEKAAARAKRQAEKAARELAEQEDEKRLLEKRQEQLKVAKAAVERLDRSLDLARERQQLRADLHDHATGFYEEIEKLAKGKSIFPSTDLVVEKANQIVSDAKALIKDDLHLDRVKEFVPAGDNPTYPDVVITVKAVLQSLGRAEPRLESAAEAAEKEYGEALTIHESLRLYCEEPDTISKDSVAESIDGDWLDEDWFRGYPKEFDFDRLDDLDLAEYLANEIDT